MTARLALLAPLKHRPFRLLFSGQVISNLGDWLDILAILALVVYQWQLGPGAWGAVLMALYAPIAIVGPFAGVWADRWPRRTVMLTCDLARAIIVFGLVWAPNIVVIVALVTAASIGKTFFGPAQKATIRATVPDDDLLAANALSRLTDDAARLVGPGLGGLLLALVGARAAFVADALSFLASALFVWQLPALPDPVPVAERASSYWQDLRAGWRHIARSRLLLITVFGMGLSAFCIASTDTLGAIVDRALGVTQNLLGATAMASGAGYVLGSLLVGQWGKRFRPVGVVGVARFGVGAVLIGRSVALLMHLHGLSIVALIVIPSFFLAGTGFAAMSVANAYLIQRETPHALMGRVSATAYAWDAALPIPAPVVATFLAARYSLGRVYAGYGVLLSLIGAALLLIRRIDPIPAPAHEETAATAG
jgi:MFS family permease